MIANHNRGFRVHLVYKRSGCGRVGSGMTSNSFLRLASHRPYRAVDYHHGLRHRREACGRYLRKSLSGRACPIEG